MKQTTRNLLRGYFLLMSAAICVSIFVMSAQNGAASTDTSGGLISFCISQVYPGFDELPPVEQDTLIASYQHLARKLAHFTIYTLLGLHACGAALTFPRLPFLWRPVLSAGFCLLYAASDELHQRFVPGRCGRLSDVLLDFAGVLTGVALALLLRLLLRRIVRRRAG